MTGEYKNVTFSQSDFHFRLAKAVSPLSENKKNINKKFIQR
jgi:hypothetical protein